MGTTGDPRLPRPVGKAHPAQGGKAHVVHSAKGPACGPRADPDPLTGYGGTLLRDARASASGVRCLAPLEVWGASGGTCADWHRALAQGLEVPALMAGVTRALPQASACALARLCASAAATAEAVAGEPSRLDLPVAGVATDQGPSGHLERPVAHGERETRGGRGPGRG